MAKLTLVAVLSTVLALSHVGVACVAFYAGATYGVERVKQWWLSKAKNTNNPHYRIIK